MPNILVEPPHIKQTKAALVEANIPLEGAIAALNLAARFYQETTQQSRTDALRQERDRTQDELERVSQELLLERQKTRQIAQQLVVAQRAAAAELKEARNIIRSLRQRIRGVHNSLTHATMRDGKKLEKIQAEIDTILANEAVTTPANAPVIDEALAPIVVVASKNRPTGNKQQRVPKIALEVTQRGRIAELEALLSRRSQYEKVADRLLSRLAEIAVQPEQPLLEAAGANLLLQNFLKRWRTLCGTVQFLLDNSTHPRLVTTQEINCADPSGDS
jgi:hypothetical protein